MKKLRSFLAGSYFEAGSGFVPLHDPSTEEVIAQASSQGADLAAALEYARREGGPALRELTFAQRGELLKAMSKVLRDNRDELLDISRRCNGTTAGDGAFDLDGASGTLSFYAGIGRSLGERTFLAEGDGIPLAKTDAFYARHVLVPRQGVAVHVNAFNFPAWGFAEKAACALLAGMPVLTKPATATALLAERCAELILAANILPAGAFQLLCGGAGDLLDHLGPQDVLAFTGSADTAQTLRRHPNVLAACPRVNIEADSLNAAALAPDAGPGSQAFDLFVREVTREMTQKAGQKCTATRRVLVPAEHLEAATEALRAKLGKTVVGDPADPAVRMGPLATAAQLRDAVAGVAELRREAELLLGGSPVDGAGAPSGKGYFFAPTLLLAKDGEAAATVHTREVFGPVATLIRYDGDPAAAARLVARAGGTLVTSAYSDDPGFLATFLRQAGATTGRLYVGSGASAEAAMGPGAALPQTMHGGPGRAGGGEELGGQVGLRLYLQRLALQGARGQIDPLAGIVADVEA
jgi:3,4-dehydroadipyl-CoA semialdehyde dehydrogenase